MSDKETSCERLGLIKKTIQTYKDTQINNPVTTGNKTIDKIVFNPITKNVPYIGSVIKGADLLNKTYQAGGHAARLKAIYEECKDKK